MSQVFTYVTWRAAHVTKMFKGIKIEALDRSIQIFNSYVIKTVLDIDALYVLEHYHGLSPNCCHNMGTEELSRLFHIQEP